ncbi:DNA-3-methyladenine glycosylase 2 family protein, partial [Paracoccaceae bacterium]|nr:DNA-3-methyladenine glycosylase 2 family protein [Paracoccaceae bacterium]
RPNEKVMREIASNWKPWRAVAARGLWAFYSYHKNREGIR